MQREVRPLADSTPPGHFAHAATGGASDSGPDQQTLAPPQDLSDTPMSGPLSNPRDIEPVSYAQPAGAPPRVVRGAYASTTQLNRARSTAPAQLPPDSRTRPITSGSGPADHGATYGYDAGYAWLQGQLEYSQATKQWKLRYVPIDGPTDRYGGSVVLAPTQALDGHKPGDFVSIKGQLTGSRTSQGTFSPLYQVTSVERLSD
jgi:hypothetical protein